MEHSKLLPPSASRLWLECTAMPQALIDSGYVNTSNHAADRGTLQHKHAEHLMKSESSDIALSEDEAKGVCTAVDSIKNFLKDEGGGEDRRYRDYHELKVAFDGWRSDCFGTSDFVRIDIGLKTLYVFDYKFGRVSVPANSSQLKVYALATIDTMKNRGVDLTKMVDNVVLGIAQPRISDKLAVHRMSMEDLIQWDDDVLAPAQRRILEGNTSFVPGPHCKYKYCKFAKKCDALNNQANGDMDDFVEKYHDLGGVAGLASEDLSMFLDKVPMIEKVIEEARAEAFNRIDNGIDIPDYKIVNGRGKWEWTSEEEAEKYLSTRTTIEQRYKKTLLTAPQAEKLLKDKLSDTRAKNIFNALVVYKEGKPTLTHESDPRPAIVSKKAVAEIDQDIADLFGDITGEPTFIEEMDLDDLLNSL